MNVFITVWTGVLGALAVFECAVPRPPPSLGGVSCAWDKQDQSQPSAMREEETWVRELHDRKLGSWERKRAYWLIAHQRAWRELTERRV